MSEMECDKVEPDTIPVDEDWDEDRIDNAINNQKILDPVGNEALPRELLLAREELDAFTLIRTDFDPARRLFLWKVEFRGLEGSPLDSFRIRLTLEFDPSKYPRCPPTAFFTSSIFHPNVYSDGRICLQLIEPGSWNPATRIWGVILAIQLLLGNPYPDISANVDAAQLYSSDFAEYRRQCRTVYCSVGSKYKPCRTELMSQLHSFEGQDGISVSTLEDDEMTLKAILYGLKSNPMYENKMYEARIEFDKLGLALAPKVYLTDRNIFHPNVVPATGRVYMGLLTGRNWTKDKTLTAILLMLQTVLAEPDVSDKYLVGNADAALIYNTDSSMYHALVHWQYVGVLDAGDVREIVEFNRVQRELEAFRMDFDDMRASKKVKSEGNEPELDFGEQPSMAREEYVLQFWKHDGRESKCDRDDADSNRSVVTWKTPPSELGKIEHGLVKWAGTLSGIYGSSHYEGKSLDFTLQFPESFPLEPPQFQFTAAQVFHPNVKLGTGAVSIARLKNHWKPSMSLRELLIGVETALIAPEEAYLVNTIAAYLYKHQREKYFQLVDLRFVD